MNDRVITPGLAVTLEQFERQHFRYHAPLTQRFVANPTGQPLKTKVAEHFPLLPRRERRLLVRNLKKSRA
jgi:hypothetical protein